MIRRCETSDFAAILHIINDGAQAYKGIIPADRWADPYMPDSKLQYEIDEGVVFWGFEQDGTLAGVMGLQPVQDVSLIRHAYVLTGRQKLGIGGKLLRHLLAVTPGTLLVGAWADATWAIHFYQRHGFQPTDLDEKKRLLTTYWKIPDRQVETSVVLTYRHSP